MTASSRNDAATRHVAYYESSSADTFDSALDESEETSSTDSFLDDDSRIPPLPVYRKAILGPTVQPSNYRVFPELFPSMDKLFIRHDEYTSDGNMNLRVDAQLPHRPQRAMQLFHLRMYDLDTRVFSLRRYCRDSGREVCRSKREYRIPGVVGSSERRHSFQNSVSNVFKSLGSRPQFRRATSSSTLFSFKSGHSAGKRPDSSLSMRSSKHDDFLPATENQKAKPTPTNTIKLMFTNYASVEVMKKGGGSGPGSSGPKRYEFEWWGRRYTWKRVRSAELGITSLHLTCEGMAPDVFLANIVPEARSPNEMTCDELDGGWMPPCTMWFSQEVDAAVAEVYVATGLIALVDDCIRERWDVKKERRRSLRV